MKYAKTRLQRICIIGCVLLDQNLPIRFAELLHVFIKITLITLY